MALVERLFGRRGVFSAWKRLFYETQVRLDPLGLRCRQETPVERVGPIIFAQRRKAINFWIDLRWI